MRIVICDYSGHPFQIELSRRLAKRGHSVLHLHFAEFQTPKGAVTPLPDDAPTFTVEGITLGQNFEKDRFLRRRFQEVEVGKLIAARALAFRPDIVIGCNMPLDAQHLLQRNCARVGVAFIFWLQDIYSAAITHYLGARWGIPGRAVGRYYQNLEGSILRASEAVVAISESFVAPLRQWGVGRERIHVIPNWAPLSDIYPVGKDNEWARAQGLHDKCVALYTGTLGLKHDPGLLLALARVEAAADLQIVVVSEGKAADWLARQAGELATRNLTVLRFQPMDVYPQILGTGDILLAMVGQEAAAFAVPSKILSYLAAGRPIAGAIASGNDAAKMIVEADAGIVTPPDDVAAFVNHVLALASDATSCARFGRNARDFAESRFAIDGIADRFEAVFDQALVRKK
ncbi:MAG: glycosyltransferase WbuB [Rhodospirillales bacterium]|nr:glycosyltransferase WbuB [Rhodospirillales bacterium]